MPKYQVLPCYLHIIIAIFPKVVRDCAPTIPNRRAIADNEKENCYRLIKIIVEDFVLFIQLLFCFSLPLRKTQE